MSTLEQNITGQAYWRSLEEYANTPEFQQRLQDEFADYEPDEIQSMSRRTFLKLAGASMALAGLTMTGCRRWPKAELAPFASRPEDMIPGVPNYFASMTERGGVAHPCLVASFDGRPIKVESHPKAGYATDVFDQALTLQQYDPDRARDVTYGKGADATRSSWTAFESFLKGKVAELKEQGGGAGFAVLGQASSSPTFLRLKAELQSQMPGMTWATWEPLNRDNELAGAKLALGRAVRTQYDVAKAKVIACFDSDFLCDHPSATKNAKGWAAGRKSADEAYSHGHDHAHGDDHGHTHGWMNRMYVVEPGLTITGSAADERLPVRPSRVAHVVTAAAVGIGLMEAAAEPTLTDSEKAFVAKLVDDLNDHKGAGLVVAGPNQPAEVHALTHAINKHLENLGQTVTYTDEPASEEQTNLESLTALVAKMDAGEVDTLVMLGGNPVFDSPADIDFASALGKVKHAARLGLYRKNETAVQCEWALPMASNFECWGDGRWYDGTVAVQQPLILPLFNGRSADELLASLVGASSLAQPSSYDLVRKTFKDGDVFATAGFEGMLDDPGYAAEERGFEKDWRRAVHLGFVPGTGLAQVFEDARTVVPTLEDSAELEVVFTRGSVYDGRFANSAWLQEVPDTHTKVSWDNPVCLSVPDAEAKGLKYGDLVDVTVDGATVKLPVFIQPGQAAGVAVVQAGNGRSVCGQVGHEVGFDVYPLRKAGGLGFAAATVSGKVGHHRLALTSVHHLVNGMSHFPGFVDQTAEWGLKKRAGTYGESGTAGNIIKEGTFSDYQTKDGLSHMMGHPHGDYRLQMFNVPLQEQWTERAEELVGEHPEAAEEGWQPRTAFNTPHAWGMTIDMNSCIGCNACVIACQAENNIPTVGKDQVWRSREMHWLRTDTYYKAKDNDPSKPENVQVVHQPMTCVQCENAPCEQVCPVAATVHDAEGLNTMVYNRCIGTRYCSNNCPYKVRRFNYFDYHSKSVRQDVANPWLNMPDTQQGDVVNKIKAMVFNPDVTVRMRGVMEKCTYCTQRVQRAKIARKNAFVQNLEGKYGHEDADTPTVPDGTVVTACQDACPTDCIVFGDLNDPHSKVSRLQTHNKRTYAVLDELNHRPRTKYLAKLRNPHPSSGGGHGGDH